MEQTTYNVALACGGTGGHIFPGLATAHVLRARGHNVVIYLAGKDVERDAVKRWEGPKHVVKARGFQSKNPLHILGTLFQLFRAKRACRKLLRRQRPDVLLGMGSYACVPPAQAAFGLDVPVVLHEANVVPGRAVSHLSTKASAVAAFFEETSGYLKSAEVEVTGMPLRPELWDAALRFRTTETGKAPAEGSERFTILITGGSRGSTPLNRMASAAILHLSKIRSDFCVVHLTGRADEADMKAFYAQHSIPAEVSAFTSDMTSLYTSADLAICRSGAATCAELLAFCLPALLVPYPYAVRDHQTHNAKAMERTGCADFVPEADLSAEWLAEYIDGNMHTPERLERMRQAALRRTQVSGAEALADLVLDVAAEYAG